MTFLNPLVLLGLAAAAIPIAVHLFNFRRPQRLDFSTLRFLRAVEATALRRMRIRQWLLLALRTLALAALVLAFARPSRPARAALADTGARALAVVVDNSRSMTLRDADGPRLDRAREAARAALGTARPGDDVLLVPTAAPPGWRAVPYGGPAPARDALDALADAPGAETLTQAIARASAALDGVRHARREIVVVTDLQASTFTDSAAAGLPDDVRLRLLPVGARGAGPANTAVTDVRVAARIVEPGRPVEVTATVRRWGGRAGTVGASLLLDGQRVAETAVEVAPGGVATARFTVTPRGRGWSGGEVRLDGDEAPWDDARFFTLYVPPPPRVRLVAGEGARADLVALALAVAAERGGVVVSEGTEAALADLSGTDVVMVVGPADGGAASRLAAFVAGGGGVLAFPGADGRLDGLNALLAAVGGGQATGTLGESDGPRTATLAEADLAHPLFAGVFDTPAPTPERPDVRRALRYAPGGGDESTLMRLTNGAPLVQEIRHGDGRMLVVGVAPEPSWSDLPLRGLFVPLVHRAALWLSATDPDDGATAVEVGRVAPLRVSGATPGRALRLVAPDGTATEPPQRAVPGGVLVEADGLDRAGLWRIVEGDGADARTLRVLAVNEPARESDPTAFDVREAARRLEAITGRPVEIVETADVLDAAGGRERPLWTWLLALALVALVAETIVATAARPAAEPST